MRPQEVLVTRYADMRYVGQEHAVTVELPRAYFDRQDRDAIKREFDEVHLQRYGTSAPKELAELVSLRVTVIGTVREAAARCTSKRAAPSRLERRCAIASRCISASRAVSSRRRIIGAPSSSPATASSGRR